MQGGDLMHYGWTRCIVAHCTNFILFIDTEMQWTSHHEVRLGKGPLVGSSHRCFIPGRKDTQKFDHSQAAQPQRLSTMLEEKWAQGISGARSF